MAGNADLSIPDTEYEQLLKSIPRHPPSKDVQVIRQTVEVLVSNVQEHYRPLLPDGKIILNTS